MVEVGPHIGQRILAVQEVIQAAEDGRVLDLEVRHHFYPGVYGRELHIPAGVLLVGKTHRLAHECLLESGAVAVLSEHRGSELLEGPLHFHSAAGTKRVILALTDAVFTTYHPNPTGATDVDALERALIKEDIPYVIHECGDVRRQVCE